MAESQTKYVTPFSLIVDAVLVLAFFTFMFGVLQPHVPSNDTGSIYLWSGLTAACMSGVFWLCIQMFRVVYRFQKRKL
ncbi:MAG: hypothetical protein SFV32_09630 [Opitutaceae bacterium]|nr:hypothetical protein [Opitutaceae bacterium]